MPPSSDEPPSSRSAREESEAEQRSAPTAAVVHAAIFQEGETELSRPSSALAWSGLAAGLSMGFSLVASGLLHAHLPDTPWRPLIASLGYTVGFLIVVFGRQQLFTENTLTVMLPLLHHRNRETFFAMLRLWSVVLAANLVGALLIALVLAGTSAFDPEVRHAFREIGEKAVAIGGFGTVVLRGIFAGWLIALMVWLLPGAEPARIPVIVILTYLVSLGHLPHIVAGAVEVFYLMADHGISWSRALLSWIVPTLLGNILGGVALVAALNHAQVAAEKKNRPE